MAVSLTAPSVKGGFCPLVALTAVAFTPLFLQNRQSERGERHIQTDRQTGVAERDRQKEWDRGRERKNVCVGARVRYRVSWDLFSWLSRSVSPPSTSPVTRTHTHTHTQTHTHTHTHTRAHTHTRTLSPQITLHIAGDRGFWKIEPSSLGLFPNPCSGYTTTFQSAIP